MLSDHADLVVKVDTSIACASKDDTSLRCQSSVSFPWQWQFKEHADDNWTLITDDADRTARDDRVIFKQMKASYIGEYKCSGAWDHYYAEARYLLQTPNDTTDACGSQIVLTTNPTTQSISMSIETTPEAVTEETTPDAVTEETTPEAATEETTPDAVFEETTPEAVTEETMPEAATEKTMPKTTKEIRPKTTTKETTPPLLTRQKVQEQEQEEFVTSTQDPAVSSSSSTGIGIGAAIVTLLGLGGLALVAFLLKKKKTRVEDYKCGVHVDN